MFSYVELLPLKGKGSGPVSKATRMPSGCNCDIIKQRCKAMAACDVQNWTVPNPRGYIEKCKTMAKHYGLKGPPW